MSDHVYKKIELSGSSKTSVEDATQNAITVAAKSLQHMDWFEVQEVRGDISDGRLEASVFPRFSRQSVESAEQALCDAAYTVNSKTCVTHWSGESIVKELFSCHAPFLPTILLGNTVYKVEKNPGQARSPEFSGRALEKPLW
jgi:flavin-binding protein dodecin